MRVNLADHVLALKRTYRLSELLSSIKEKKGKPIEAIHFGSYFCERYFLHLSVELAKELKDVITPEEAKVAIVVPMANQSTLALVKNHLDEFVQIFGETIDSIVINDYGMLEYVARTYSGIKIIVGRLLYKQTRDVRLKKFVGATKEISPFSDELGKIYQAYPICGFEVEDVEEGSIIERKGPYEILIHTPVVYFSTGKVCEFASIHKPTNMKFRPNAACAAQCAHFMNQYDLAGDEVYKIGRTVYYKGLDHVEDSSFQEVYTPFQEVISAYENLSSAQ